MCEWDKTTTNIYNKLHEYKLIDHYKKIIKKTNESQGHGKAWEIDIQKNIYGIDKKYNNTQKYDIPAEDNLLHHKNVSIKTSCSMNIDMSDIDRLLNSENMDVVCVIYKQIGRLFFLVLLVPTKVWKSDRNGI